MKTHSSSPNSGFALIIALSLMAFVLLLLLSITTLVKVESKNAQGSMSQSQARQNALLALNIAIGQLQKDTGPDQRVTALAALDDGTGGTSINQPNWVGVYGNSSAANYSATPDTVNASAPVLLNWLVSGNEGTDYTAANTSTEFGRITAGPTAIIHEPDAITSDLLTATANTEITIGGIDAQLLVGPNSTNAVDASGKAVASDADEATANYVAAPLVEIQTNNSTSGRYAWWVGDEGAKAKVNLRPSYLDQESSDQSEYQNYSFMTAQRAALEFVEYDDSGNRLDTEFDFTDPKLERIRELSALAFLGSGSSPSFQSVVSERFHDITTDGHGVLADAYAGGLKKDLTADFNDSAQRPSDDTKLFTPLNADDHIPTWGKARSLVETSISDRKVDPVLPSDTSNGISPVFTVASLGFDFYLAGPVVDPVDPSIAWYEFRVAIIPAVALWNPHTVEINAAEYEVGLRIDSDSGKSEVWVDFGTSESDEADVLNLHTGSWKSNPNPNNNFLRFRLEGKSLPPGENQLYSLETNGDAYNPGVNLMTISDPVLENLYNHVAFTTENLRIPAIATLTGGGTYTYSPPPDVFPRVGSNSTRNADDEMRFNVALAAPNGLSNLSDRDQWYQAILDARLYHRGAQRDDSRASGGDRANVWLEPNHYGNNLGDLLYDAPYELIGDNISAYRMLMPTERRGRMLQRGYWHGALMSNHSNNAARLRWLVTGNPRAPIICNTKIENDHTVSGTSLHAAIHYSNGLTDPKLMGDSLFFPYSNDANTNKGRLSMGRSQNGNQASFSVAVLFDHLESTNNFVSLGQLQHSMVSNYGFHPTYQFGNSWADVRIDRDQHFLANHFSTPYDTSNSQTLYDISWHMNRAVWDRYFVSTVPYTGSNALTAEHIADNRPLPNSRMNYYDSPDLATVRGDDAYDEAAANLWIDGAFNINSTSEQAWRSLLSSTFGIPDDDGSFADSGDNVSTIAPIPRFSSNQSQTGHNGTDFTESMKNRTTNGNSLNYIGNRGLSMEFNGVSNGTVDEIVIELARTIVEEVKIRGPFLSLGDFVNRAIIEEDPSSDDDDIGIKGALQAAIDKMSPGSGNTGPRVNSYAWHDNHANGLLRTDVEAIMGDKWNVEHYLGGPDIGTNKADMPYSTNATGSPKCMSAADLLTVIGPAVSARSDTFKIRTYGETVNPVTQKTKGRAWCEAIVQRLPDYVDSTDEPDIAPTALTSIANAQFGRKYKILSLRWLDASEI